MTVSIKTLESSLRQRLGDSLGDCSTCAGQLAVEIPAPKLLEACTRLRDDESLAFRQLVDLCGVDYAGFGKADWQTSADATRSGFSRGVGSNEYAYEEWQKDRFAVVYQLLSHTHNQRLTVRTYADGDPPRVDSVCGIWPCADWYEREAFDLFGILFDGHMDLRRLLTDYGFIGHPFRKDFPISGHVEMRFDPEKKRVVYEPVSIEPRVLVPRVIREAQDSDGGESGGTENA